MILESSGYHPLKNMMTKLTRKSLSPPSDSKTTNDFRDWLPKDKFEELIEKSQRSDLLHEEKALLIEEMSYFGCPIEEIATLLNTTTESIHNNFKDVINRSLVRWRIDLRKAQVKNGLEGKGSTAMLIWLGKQYLAQKEDPQLDVKKEKFDEFIQWMRSQAPSTEYHQNNMTSSSMQMHETT